MSKQKSNFSEHNSLERLAQLKYQLEISNFELEIIRKNINNLEQKLQLIKLDNILKSLWLVKDKNILKILQNDYKTIKRIKILQNQKKELSEYNERLANQIILLETVVKKLALSEQNNFELNYYRSKKLEKSV